MTKIILTRKTVKLNTVIWDFCKYCGKRLQFHICICCAFSFDISFSPRRRDKMFMQPVVWGRGGDYSCPLGSLEVAQRDPAVSVVAEGSTGGTGPSCTDVRHVGAPE